MLRGTLPTHFGGEEWAIPLMMTGIFQKTCQYWVSWWMWVSWSLANNFSFFLFLSLKFHLHQVYYSRLGTLAERSRRQAHLHFHSHGELLILGNVSEVILGGLRPWSRYQVQLAVLNGRGEGPRSEAMEFVTPEGGKNQQPFTLRPFNLCFPLSTFWTSFQLLLLLLEALSIHITLFRPRIMCGILDRMYKRVETWVVNTKIHCSQTKSERHGMCWNETNPKAVQLFSYLATPFKIF